MCPTLSDTATMNNIYYGKVQSHAVSDIILENSYDRGLNDVGFQNSKYHWKVVS